MVPHRPIHLAALGLALAALAVPTASARPDGPLGQQPVATSSLAGTTSPTDLRSPDAQDAAAAPRPAVVRPAPAGDHRTPDAKDAATAATGRVIAPRAPLAAAPAADKSGGTDWGDVALGGAAVVALLLALAGALLAVHHRGARKSRSVVVSR
jgi:hypothetical protein